VNCVHSKLAVPALPPAVFEPPVVLSPAVFAPALPPAVFEPPVVLPLAPPLCTPPAPADGAAPPAAFEPPAPAELASELQPARPANANNEANTQLTF